MNIKKINILIISAAIGFIFNIQLLFAQSFKPNLNIVYVGNSITYGAGLNAPLNEAPPVKASAYLSSQANIGHVEFSNQGHSGYTTFDFLPSTEAFKEIERTAQNFKDKTALLIFSVELGTNDSAISGPNGSPVSPVTYSQNLKTISDSLLKEFPECIIIFHHPIWYSPNTDNGAKYLAEGLARLQTYVPQLHKIVADYGLLYPKHVFIGDQKAFHFFKKNYLAELQPENGHRGIFYVHPNSHGAAVLGTFWGAAINKVIKQISTSE